MEYSEHIVMFKKAILDYLTSGCIILLGAA